MSLTRFTVEYVRANPQLSVAHAVAAATQLAPAVDLARYDTFAALSDMTRRLQLRTAFEWDVYGYKPTGNAVPVILDRADGNRALETHYLSEHTTRPHHSHDRLQPFEEVVRDAKKLVTGGEADYSRLFPDLPTRRLRILGNLWRLGIAVTVDDGLAGELSRTRAGSARIAGERPDPSISEFDAWWHIAVNPALGRDVVPEIVRAAAAILLDGGNALGAESEAVSYIVCERMWIPPRRAETAWLRGYRAGEAPPADFDIDRVYATASRVEQVLRGHGLSG